MNVISRTMWLLVFCCVAFAANDTNTTSGLTSKGPGLALHGYDAVAFFTEHRAVEGTARHAVVYNEATYRFSSEENRAAFARNPEKYVPQFGGFCAYGVSVGAKFDGDPRYWKIVGGKLYVNLNGDIQQTWLKDVSGNIHKAEKAWGKIAAKPAAALK
ncbi:YHS domain-containing protein [Sulfidibacter corallicola]|uniref:YHS domain-containing protein n=1 Tax=Sulfidibacter corallicola TaxID=2818388 RepID=A0A8A4TFA5_SULCO|nr:YHS domain-containing (seleno)protein [Sulfidibacter corallicola]QTD48779.1 YHS domain-containing protein [Sulfidibacter corallicola]